MPPYLNPSLVRAHARPNLEPLEIPISEVNLHSAASRSVTPAKSEEFKSFRETFDKYMPSSRKPIEHENVGVLLLSFDSNLPVGNAKSLDVSDEVKRLEDVFKNDYNFDVANKVIDRRNAVQQQANAFLSHFTLEHSEKEHTLIIVYYAGHGWRSNDWKRKAKGGFNLMSGLPQRKLPPHKGTYIMWEKAEMNLHDFEGDVLVIFDCCDAGYLSKRGPGHTFEYLAACEEGKYTHEPGQHSFTSALIWALTELKGRAPFTTKELKEKIQEHKWFPQDQNPVLFSAREEIMEPIWIAPLRPKSVASRLRSTMFASEFRSSDCSYVDLRFIFNQPLTSDDAKHLAAMISPAVQDKKLKFNARHVSVLDKGKLMGQRWRKARNTILPMVVMHRVNKQVYDDESPPPRKRSRTDREDNEIEARQQIIQASHVPPAIATPISEDTQSDMDA